jgi:hypothetical protein
MRKGLKRSGLLLFAIGILALAYHFGNQFGSSIPYEPTPYDPEDLAAPIPIIEESHASDSQPANADSNALNPSNVPQSAIAIPRRIKITSVQAAENAPIEMKPKAVVVKVTPEKKKDEGGRMKVEGAQVVNGQGPVIVNSRPPVPAANHSQLSTNSVADLSYILHPSTEPPSPIPSASSRPDSPPPTPAVSRRRIVEEDDVAWHVIENSVTQSKSNPAAGARLFAEPGTPSMAPVSLADRARPRELSKSITDPMVTSAPIEPTPKKEPAAEKPKPIAFPKQSGPILQPDPDLTERKTPSQEKSLKADSSDSDRGANSRSRVAEDASQPVKPVVNKPPQLTQRAPREAQPVSKPSSPKVPVTPPAPLPTGTSSSASTGSSAIAKSPPAPPAAAKITESTVALKAPDSKKQTSEKPQVAAAKVGPKVRIVGLYPVVKEVKSVAQSPVPANQPMKQESTAKVAPARLEKNDKARRKDEAAKSPSSSSSLILHPSSLQRTGSELAVVQNPPKSKITELQPISLESKLKSSPAKPVIQGVIAASGTASTSPSVQHAVHQEIQSVAKEIAKPPPAKPALPSEGVIFLPPAELPPSITGEASELATQKLIARSMSSPTGVAAKLAHAKAGSSGVDGSELILASARIDYDPSSEDEGHAKSYSTTGTVQLKASKEEIAAGAHLDYVTNGVVILGDPELADLKSSDSQLENLKSTAANSAFAVREQSLRRSIEAVCGDKIRNLELNLKSDHILRIRIQVPRDLEGELRHTILAIPVLANYQVHLDIQVSP